MREIRVAVDARMAFASGIGRYIRSLVPRLAARASRWHFTLLGDRERLVKEDWAQARNVDCVECSAPIYSMREQIAVPLATPSAADLFWAPHYNVPLLSRLPLVVTVHDVAHLRLESFRQNIAQRAYATALFEMVRRKAGAIICDSRFTRDEFAALVGAATRMEVVHLGIDDAWFQGAANGTGPRPLEPPYFVFVGDFKPHKNLSVLLDAFALVAQELDAALVLIGRQEGFRARDERIEQRLSALGSRVRVAGAVDDETLRRYLRHATALVSPSLYEGFGFAPLEAMAAGSVAIVSRAGSLPEVCGDAAIYFDCHSVTELADRLRDVARSAELRRSLGERGRAHARRFDWEASAARTLAVFEWVLNRAA